MDDDGSELLHAARFDTESMSFICDGIITRRLSDRPAGGGSIMQIIYANQQGATPTSREQWPAQTIN